MWPSAIDQPVLETQRVVRPVRPRVCSQHALAVVRMQHANEQVAVGQPFLRRVAEQSFDLRAREDVGARLVERVDVDDEWELLDERLVSPSDVVVVRHVEEGRGAGSAAVLHTSESTVPSSLPSPDRGIRDRLGFSRQKAARCGGFRRAAGLGLEPRLPDPESGVLPLDDPAGRRQCSRGGPRDRPLQIELVERHEALFRLGVDVRDHLDVGLEARAARASPSSSPSTW